ncbi:PREDICTED: uncharacterized protein LOC109221582 [Nicotiana attenuata]|uniref:uncharacterized protein LOC109221582 n=1 Tax=Nicotiana attenuata TaxID=49451 RepID=UPI00090471C1|nr:PREDICTED: uncharacterized protein LOC109221582 [Nicotiana attenuata]
MKYLGELKYFLGIEFARSKQEILMHQRKYALKLISETGLGAAKPAITPLDYNIKRTTKEYDDCIKISESDTFADDKEPEDHTPYQRLIVAELIWMIGLLKEVDFQIKLPVDIYSDSKAAMQIAANPTYNEKTKHIKIDCHFIREKNTTRTNHN